ncbi:BEL1-like homeodomain protein 4 isoform X1 [Populus alba x Populus x berolinensis]|uniref:BEL1-like homeodomain protein 4 isoform X1 n=1 Tax=Populus alba x Populus x berolinensis TaxID=444605 RepID=A0AAD6W7G1_9ROSI|nr:BEL1-like homeodomain protein 4 isoform X1 [Populus alba x Populus x berolinensis]
MDTRNLSPDSHVAQQSRRDKLRVQQSLSSVQHIDEFPNCLEHYSIRPGLSPDPVHVRNIRNGNILYDSTMFSSEMLNFATSSHAVSASKDAVVDQELEPIPAEASSFTSMSHPVLSNFNASSPKSTICDPQECGNWRSLDSQQIGGERNQKYVFVGEVLSNNARVSNISTSRQYWMPSYFENQDVQLPFTLRNSSGRRGRCKLLLFHYQNTLLDDVIPSGCFRPRINERIVHSSYATASTALHIDNNTSTWMSRPLENYHHWSGEFGLIARTSDQELRTIGSDANTQGLSLSLSSINPPSKVEATHFGEGCASEHLQLKVARSRSFCAMPKPSIISKGGGKSLLDVVGTSTHAFRSTGPLGPFTGFATILKSSGFLKPAQELLEEFSIITGPKLMRTFEMFERISGDQVSAPDLADTVNTVDEEGGTNGNDISGISSSTFYSSNKRSGSAGVGGGGGRSCGSYGPEYQQMKAKLLFLEEEVCLLFSSLSFFSHFFLGLAEGTSNTIDRCIMDSFFFGISGWLSAEPVVTLGSQNSLREFQLKLVTKAVGDDLIYRNTVAVVNADKHMLATQTGSISKPGVKWFINAGCACGGNLWLRKYICLKMKPKGLAEEKVGKNDGENSAEGNRQSIDEERLKQDGFQILRRYKTNGMLMALVPLEACVGLNNAWTSVLFHLTLGLRQGIEIAQHQIQMQQHKGHFKQPYGSQMYS